MNWKLKDVLMIAVCAVLFGVIFLGATYAGGMLYGILAPFGLASLGYEFFYGIYFLGGAFALYVMRKPGAGIIAEILGAVIETLLGNFFGPIIILSGFVQGFGFELVIAMKKYKKLDIVTLIEASICCSVITLIYNLIISGYNKIAVPVLALMLAVRIISAVIFDAFINKKIGDKLARAGVLNAYEISKDINNNPE